MLNLRTIIFGSIAFTIIFNLFTPEVNSTEDIVENDSSSALVCLRDGDKNKGHGNDPYVEFAMNLKLIGKIDISGRFDLDNPGKSLDKQMIITANSQEIFWTSLNDSQKQQIKDEWRKQICLPENIFSD